MEKCPHYSKEVGNGAKMVVGLVVVVEGTVGVEMEGGLHPFLEIDMADKDLWGEVWFRHMSTHRVD